MIVGVELFDLSVAGTEVSCRYNKSKVISMCSSDLNLSGVWSSVSVADNLQGLNMKMLFLFI